MGPKKYTPTITYLVALGFQTIRTYKHERLALVIPGNPDRKLYYFPLYNSFRYSGIHIYPESDKDVETMVRCFNSKK